MVTASLALFLRYADVTPVELGVGINVNRHPGFMAEVLDGEHIPQSGIALREGGRVDFNVLVHRSVLS